jgi:hypothetical protein
MLEPWLREFGFIICYGAIVLKLYRHLVEFRTRKAHRYVVRDLDLLRYLCAMIVAVLCYLAAFTALCFDYLDYSELIWNFEMENVTTLNMCKPLKWDYVSNSETFFSSNSLSRITFSLTTCAYHTYLLIHFFILKIIKWFCIFAGNTSWRNVDINIWHTIGIC